MNAEIEAFRRELEAQRLERERREKRLERRMLILIWALAAVAIANLLAAAAHVARMAVCK